MMSTATEPTTARRDALLVERLESKRIEHGQDT